MASYAIEPGGDVVGRLANPAGSVGAMAYQTVGRRIEVSMIWHAAYPSRCSSVATFTRRCARTSDWSVHRSSSTRERFGGDVERTDATVLVADYALPCNRNVGVQQTRVPTGEPPFMAGVTICRTCQTRIGNVGCRLAVCG
jgi:hypothetical protein